MQPGMMIRHMQKAGTRQFILMRINIYHKNNKNLQIVTWYDSCKNGGSGPLHKKAGSILFQDEVITLSF